MSNVHLMTSHMDARNSIVKCLPDDIQMDIWYSSVEYPSDYIRDGYLIFKCQTDEYSIFESQTCI